MHISPSYNNWRCVYIYTFVFFLSPVYMIQVLSLGNGIKGNDSCNHRVIILPERACLHNIIGRNWGKISRPECATSPRDVTRHCANDPKGWGLRGNSPGIAASPISLLSMVALEESVAGVNGGENSLHWKTNMLPLFSIKTLWLPLWLQ